MHLSNGGIKGTPISFHHFIQGPAPDIIWCGGLGGLLVPSPLLSPEFAAPIGRRQFRPSPSS